MGVPSYVPPSREMNKVEWKTEYRETRLKARVIAEEIFLSSPEIVRVDVPFFMPMSCNFNTSMNIGTVHVKRLGNLGRAPDSDD